MDTNIKTWKERTLEERKTEIERLPEYRKTMTQVAIAKQWGASLAMVRYWEKQLLVKKGITIEPRKRVKSMLE